VISVIVPLERDRGQAAAVASWEGQDPPPGGFEVVPVSGVPNVFELYHRGARRARGETLLFTEGHCLARPGCLTALAPCLAENPLGFVNLAVEGVATNHISRIDARVDRREWARLVAAGDWRAISHQGVAVARETYEGLGGFSYEFGGFAWVAMALRAAQAGVRITHADRAVVAHVYRDSLREIGAMTAAHVRGELAFRRSVPSELWLEDLGDQPLARGRAGLGERAAAGRDVVVAALGCHARRRDDAVLDEHLRAFLLGLHRLLLMAPAPRVLPAPRTSSPWRAAHGPSR
jgi:hypothetical protein